MKPFGESLRELRRDFGLSQKALAGRELTRAQISAVERGIARLSVSGLVALAPKVPDPAPLILSYCTTYPPAPSWSKLIRFLVLNGWRDLARSVVTSAQARLGSVTPDASKPLEANIKAWSLHLEEQHSEAATRFAEASVQAAASKRWYEATEALWDSGEALARAGDLTRALHRFRRARAALGSRQNRRAFLLRGHLWRSEVAVLQRLGLYRQAYESAARARASYRDAGSRAEEGHALLDLGTSLLNEGRYREAETALHEANNLLRQGHHDRCGLALTLNLGMALAGMGRVREATQFIGTAASGRSTQPTIGAYASLELARLHAGQGRLDEARAAVQMAVGECDPTEHVRRLAVRGALGLLPWPAARARILAVAQSRPNPFEGATALFEGARYVADCGQSTWASDLYLKARFFAQSAWCQEPNPLHAIAPEPITP